MNRHLGESQRQAADPGTHAPESPSINDSVRSLEVSEGGMQTGGLGGMFAVQLDEDVLDGVEPLEATTMEIPPAGQKAWDGEWADLRISPAGSTREGEGTSVMGGPGRQRRFLDAVYRQRVA